MRMIKSTCSRTLQFCERIRAGVESHHSPGLSIRRTSFKAVSGSHQGKTRLAKTRSNVASEKGKAMALPLTGDHFPVEECG